MQYELSDALLVCSDAEFACGECARPRRRLREEMGLTMKMDVLINLPAEDGDGGREIGALVTRPHPAGGVTVEVGAADAPPVVRFLFSTAEAHRLCQALQRASNGGDETILLNDD